MTDEKLRLAPRVAEIMGLKNELFGLCFGIWEDEADIVLGHYDGGGGILVAEDSPFWPDTITPLPTLEQCLDWLREKGFMFELRSYAPKGDYLMEVFLTDGFTQEDVCECEEQGSTAREAAYRAVIAVGGKEGG